MRAGIRLEDELGDVEPAWLWAHDRRAPVIYVRCWRDWVLGPDHR